MKKIDMAKAIGLADEAFVAEAAPKATRTKSIFGRKFAIVAACVSLVVTSVFLWLLLPFSNEVILPDFDNKKDLPEELKAYADSEYIDLIYAIYKNGELAPKKENGSYLNGEYRYFIPSVTTGLLTITDLDSDYIRYNGSFDSDGFDSNSDEEGSTLCSSYVETTDNQVKGVIEADLFKRTETHIFYFDIDSRKINVYSIAGSKSQLVSDINLTDYVFDSFENLYLGQLFLSKDGKTLTVLSNSYKLKRVVSTGNLYADPYTFLISFDVSDPENIKENGRFAISGSYSTARVVDGEILLFTEYFMDRPLADDYSDIEDFVPSINCGEGFALIPAEDIIIPDGNIAGCYTVVSKLNESDLSFKGSIACLSFSETVYVSEDKIFLTRLYSDCVEREKDGKMSPCRINMTEITAISYKGGGFRKLGSVCVEGSVKNQYSLDEFNGILRIVTTTGGTSYLADKYLVTEAGLFYGEPGGELVKTERIETNASLYCIDLSNFEIVGEVRDFAPAGETVESVRFDGTNAYVCTAVVVTFTDPVYFFDLSDLNNITYTDTGYIDGFSSSLVNFGEGLLLGIGYGENRSTLKIEVYAEESDKVVSLDSYEVEGVTFSTDYKSYYIDRERGLVGLMFDEWRIGDGCRYVLLGFDGYQLFEVVNQKFDVSFSPDKARATIADNYFYMMVSYEFKAIKLFD
ncbi:MAG: beta-propeller domain-containing protein [Clostridia bacterium]|nr:beta-propeller domain-containing protein [Clostridia bacterium]